MCHVPRHCISGWYIACWRRVRDMHKPSHILRSSFWLWLQDGTDTLLAFAFAWIALRRLGPAGFGLVSLTQSLLNLAGLGTLSLELALVRLVPEFLSRQQWRTANGAVYLVAGAKLVLAGCMAGVISMAAPWLADFYRNPELASCLRAGCLSLVAAALAEVGAAGCLAVFHAEVRTAMTTTRRLCELTGLIVISSLGKGAVAVILVLGLADLVAALGYTVKLTQYLRQAQVDSQEPVLIRPLVQRILRYCIPIVGSRVAEVAGREAGKLILGRLASPVSLGHYSVARLMADRISSFMGQAPLATVPALASGASEQPASRRNQLIDRLLRYQWLGGSLLALVIWAAAPVLLVIVGGQEYIPAVPALRILMFAALCCSATLFLHAAFMAQERTLGVFLTNLVNLMAAIVFYGLLASRWQIGGVAIADVMGQLAALGLGLWLSSRWLQFEAGRLSRYLLSSGCLVVLVVLPVGVLNYQGPVLGLWLIVGLILVGSHALLQDIPDAGSWRALGQVVLPAALNRIRDKVIYALRRYQEYLQHRFRRLETE